MKSTCLVGRVALALSLCGAVASAAPRISRLTPPSGLFSFGDPSPPIISRFLPGQRFDLQATIQPEAGKTVSKVEFLVNGTALPGTVSLANATAGSLPAGTTIGTLRAFSKATTGVHTLTARATQSDGQAIDASGNFEIVSLAGPVGSVTKARNVIVMIGDGMGIAHRTAARVLASGVSQGKVLAPLAMDQFPAMALVQTHSLNSIVTDSAPGAAVYSTGNKNDNRQEGVFPDDTSSVFDNPRIENIGEFLARTQGKSLGIVTTADISDATPGAFGAHTQERTAGTGICDQYLDEAVSKAKLSVLLGGGRKWFLPSSTPGTGRNDSTDYVLPTDLASAWGVPAGALDSHRDLLAEFRSAGFTYAATATQLAAIPAGTTKLLGLFASSTMNAALDKIAGRRGTTTVAMDSGYPDQPMLDEMTKAALSVLARNPAGFVLMIEGASIDKQSHYMDGDRLMLEVLEFDRSVEVVRQFILANPDTLAVVTADHESGGINVIGASVVNAARLKTNDVANASVSSVRDSVVGTYEQAGFPYYKILFDGYPESTDVANKILLGFAANADRWESWTTRNRPDNPSTMGYLVTGQVPGSSAVHTASDVPLSAMGAGSALFSGVMDNTDVFFRLMQAAVKGVSTTSTGSAELPPANASPPSGAGGNLVNLSTRGFVGTGDRAMVSGFVIDGTQPRTMLVRGDGPSLAKLGISGILPRPQLTLLNASGALVATNDGWAASTDALAIRGAASRVGAFPFDEGSQDAALLVTLPPGNYTVRLAGVNETTGMAMIEVYSVP